MSQSSLCCVGGSVCCWCFVGSSVCCWCLLLVFELVVVFVAGV